MRTLLIDTCGEEASIALAKAAAVVATMTLPARSASATLLASVTALLQQAGWQLAQLEAIGVVNGPGSFTGVRVGLSCAKGLCEALSIPLALVSRLQVLATAAAPASTHAALNAGRGELFVLDLSTNTESLEPAEAFRAAPASTRIVICEPQLRQVLGPATTQVYEITAATALPLILARLREGGDDIGSADANYLRGEQQIYGKSNLTTPNPSTTA